MVMELHYLDRLYEQVYLLSSTLAKYLLGIPANGNDWRRLLLLFNNDLQQLHSQLTFKCKRLTSFEDEQVKWLPPNNIKIVLDIDHDFLPMVDREIYWNRIFKKQLK